LADKWQLRFNVDKCKTMHLGGASQETRVRYEMKRPNGPSPQILEETKEEKDLGMVILKSSEIISTTCSG